MIMEKQKWRSVNTVNNGSSKPSPRWGHSNCVIGEEVVLFGGYAGIPHLILQIPST